MVALASVSLATVQAQGLGGFLNKAKAKVNQTTGSKPDAAKTAQSVTSGADDTGLPPRLPSPDELTPENNLSSALAILHNRRPYEENEYGTPDVQDHQYRRMRFEWKNPVEFTFDRPFAEYATRQRRWLFNVAANVCETLEWMSSTSEDMRYKRAKVLKIKEWHFTTTTKLPSKTQDDRYAGTQGYIMSFDPATGVLTCAASVPMNHLTNFRGEDIVNFINDNVK